MQIYSLEKLVENTIIIEKSKFITYLLPVFSKQEIENKLEEFRQQHQSATHVCYAWILNDHYVLNYKSSDDGEPSSTAGAPILNGLRKNHLENVLCVVVRYFGGIKLGAGGLSRAYGKSCSEAIKKATLVSWYESQVFEIWVSYENEKKLLQWLQHLNGKVLFKTYDLEVRYTIAFANEDELLKLKNERTMILKEQFLYQKWIKM